MSPTKSAEIQRILATSSDSTPEGAQYALPMGSLFQQTVAVFVVLALLVATLWFLRAKGVARLRVGLPGRLSSCKLMQVIERVPLTAQHSLHLVRIQDRVILIGVSPSGCNGIESFPASSISTEKQGI